MSNSSKQVCDELLELIYRLKHLTATAAEARGLTQVQLFALFALDRHGEMPMGEVAQVMHCDASNVTGVVDRLVAQSLLVREEHQQDRRTKILRLTPKGKHLVDDLLSTLPEQLGCNKLNSHERTTLHNLVSKMSV